MVSELQTTLRRLQAKSDVLLEKYHALKLEKEAVEQENDQLRSRLAQLDKEIEKLRLDYEYLQMARMITPTRESVVQSRAILAKLVQDVDKCISQLME
ncbi:MAG: hypothetical protein Q4Q28_08690 [Bacteroidales bacterium]|nr:hypothetical protein [Bacteroidales bacterium]MEE0908356.1 hypothetical protein [Muribaculaceae bacterium]